MVEVTGMRDENHRYLDSCPVGCQSPLLATELVFPVSFALTLDGELISLHAMFTG